MSGKCDQKKTRFSGQRRHPIKPPKKSAADFTRMALEYEMMKRAEHKEVALQMLETMAEEAPLHITSFANFPEDFVRKMFSKMACRWCNFIPSPYRRYLCPDGHQFCDACGKERFIKHGGKCMIEDREGSTEFSHANKEVTDESSSTLVAPRTSDPYHFIDGSNHFPVCQKKIRLYPADPVFASMWVCAVWKCPGGCNEAFQGRDLLQHLMYCIHENKSQLDEESEEISEEEDSLVLVVEPEKEDSIVKGVQCIVSGCSKHILVKDVVEHVILRHGIYAMDAGDDVKWPRQKAGLLYIPQSAIEARGPYYTLIRYYRRFFLFCMEPSTQNPNDLGFWIRRISNMENKEEESGPYFKYDLHMVGKFRDMQVTYKNSCIPWRKPTSEVLEENQCMALPVSFVLDQLVLICEDQNSVDSDEEDEEGYLPMNFRIFVENAVGEFYLDEVDEPGTSSMESLAVASTSALVTVSEGSELTTEGDNKGSDVDDYQREEDEEEEELQFVTNRDGIAGSNHKIKIWFERNYYKDEVFNCQYSP